jgi:flagellar motor switch protein FliN
MSEFTAEQIDSTIETCRAHLEPLAEAFRTSLGCEVRLSAGEPSGLDAAGDLADFQVPGLVVSMVVGEQGLIVLIPQTLPLPAWYREPDASQNNRLQTLAQELSVQLLPADLPAESYAAIATENLIEVAQSAQATASAKMVELSVFPADGTPEAASAKILVIVPVAAPPAPWGADTGSYEESDHNAIMAAFAEEGAETELADADADSELQSAAASGDSHSAAVSAEAALRALRIMRVPVTVSVRLAERKMSLGTVVALVPGSLVTFNKSCEDLLDLYVNNHRFCQGEAIKIGESFGLKVTKVGLIEERGERIV